MESLREGAGAIPRGCSILDGRTLACQTATDKARAFSLTIGDEEGMTSALQQATTPVRLGERVASSVDLPATGPPTHADRPSSEVDATYVGRYGIQSACPQTTSLWVVTQAVLDQHACAGPCTACCSVREYLNTSRNTAGACIYLYGLEYRQHALFSLATSALPCRLARHLICHDRRFTLKPVLPPAPRLACHCVMRYGVSDLNCSCPDSTLFAISR